MAINFSAQFIVNKKTSSRVLCLTDTSTGFTLAKGNFSVTFPDGSQVLHTDFISPDINTPGGSVDIALITDIDNTVLTGTYVIDFVALDAASTQYTKQESFDFNWEKPTKSLINESDVVIPTITFRDSTPYEISGNFTGTLTRNFYTTTPSTSEVGVITKTSVGDVLIPSNASKYYEGIYLVKSDISVAYTHSSLSWLTVLYTDLLQETYDIREAPTQLELVTLMNEYKDQIEVYKTTNPSQYEILNEEYDLVVALYSHIVARYESGTLEGCKPILDQLLGLLPPTEPYTYKATQMLPFAFNAAGGAFWGSITGTLSNQTDLQAALDLKAPLASPTFTGTVSGITKAMVGLSNVDNTSDINKPVSSATQTALNLKYDASNPSGYISGITSGQVTTALGFTPENAANKGVNNGYASLDGAGKVPSTQLPSYVDDIVEVANYAALPATGETGKIYVVLDTNKIYRWSGSAYIEIADSTAVWGAITGTLSSQTDLQNALNAKFDDPTGDTTQYIAGDGSLVTFPIAGQAGTLVREVRNTTGATLTKGTIVYISGATGNKPTVSKALATGDSTSAQTFGMCQADIANNANGYVVCVGDIVGLDTSAISEGVQLYLSSTTAGTYTTTKQLAPAHLVYIGVVTRSHPTQGQIEVKIQNGYELDEIHNVAAQTPSNNDGLFWETATSLWKNKSLETILGGSPITGTGTTNYVPKFTSASSIGDSNIQDSGSLITLGSNSYVNGALGIETSSLTGYSLRASKNITGATTAYGVSVDGTIQSDVTAQGRGYYTNLSTAASAFTLFALTHFHAEQATIGAGSTVTTQTGFLANSTLTGATTNYGFRGLIASGTNRWNIYMDGTANNYMAGALGIGTTSLTNTNLRVSKNITGGSISLGIFQNGIVQSDVTSIAYSYYSSMSTSAASFSVSNLLHFAATQGTLGAGSSASVQTGFYVDNTLIGATNNYGFRGQIASGTNRYNIYMDGTADNYLAGSLGIGSSSLTGFNLRVSKNITGAIDSLGLLVDGTIQSDVTRSAFGLRSELTTQAASFNLNDLVHISSSQKTLGAGSSITNQFGFYAYGTLIGATNNYGFFGNIASGTGRWNIYMQGTASNFLAGPLGIGSTSLANTSLRIVRNATGGVQYLGVDTFFTFQSDVTATAVAYNTNLNTQAASFTLSEMIHFRSAQGTIGAGSTVTNQYGFFAQSNLIGATNNYGFFGQIAAGTGRWNLFMNGTAANYLAGNLLIGSTTDNGNALQVTGALTTTSDSSINGVVIGKGVNNLTYNIRIGSANLLNVTTGDSNVAIGANALQVNTTGLSNIAIGRVALLANTTGNSNVAVGRSTLSANTTGYQNTAIGESALNGNTTGLNNAAFGFYALVGNTTGSQNVALGMSAGRYIADGTTVNTIISNSIFIGQNTKALADNQTNQVVIGHAVTGLGSNTTVLGNTSTTLTALYGAVITGGTSVNASAQLQVDSTTKGFLPPRMTAAQRAAIGTPAEGLVVVQTDGTQGLYLYIGAAWHALTML